MHQNVEEKEVMSYLHIFFKVLLLEQLPIEAMQMRTQIFLSLPKS